MALYSIVFKITTDDVKNISDAQREKNIKLNKTKNLFRNDAALRAAARWKRRPLAARGASVTAALGFGSAAESFYIDDFAALGAAVAVYTADGSMGKRGLVTEALGDFGYTSVYACGALEMLRAIDRAAAAPA